MKPVKRRCHTVDYIDSDATHKEYIKAWLKRLRYDGTHKEYIKVWLKRLRYDGNKITAMMSIYNSLSSSTMYMKDAIS
jgi:hypothetical protein